MFESTFNVPKPQPRHRMGPAGFIELDTCAIEPGHQVIVVTELGKAMLETTFTRMSRDRGAMHDWTLSDYSDQRYMLTHQRPTEGVTFIDRSVILKIGNELDCAPWDITDAEHVQHLGKIVSMEVRAPEDSNVIDNVHPLFAAPAFAVSDMPLANAA